MDNISKKDYDILFELQNNARSPLNKIAKKIKMSQQGLHYRLKHLEEKKVILHYYTIIDYACFHYLGYKVIFTLHAGKKESDAFLKTLLNHPSILSLVELGGQWDYMVLFAEKNASRCNKDLHALLAQYPKLIKNYFVLTHTVGYELGRRYLTENTISTQSIVLGGDREKIRISILEQLILKDLYENPRISYVEIAVKHKLNPKTVISKVKALQTKGVLKGYSITPDCYSYDYMAHKIFIKFSPFSFEKEEELLKFCRQQKALVRISKLFGHWDFELDIEVQNLKELQKFCLLFRSAFGEMMQSMDISPVLKYHKYACLPHSFFSESIK